MLFFPVFAVFAAAKALYYADEWFKTPLIFNVYGAACVFLAVMALGYAIPHSVDSDPNESVIWLFTSAGFLGGAALMYVFGHLVRRRYPVDDPTHD